MMDTTPLYTATFEPPPPERRTILRYAGSADSAGMIGALLEDALDEALPALSYRVCWRRLPCRCVGSRCQFGLLSVVSSSLARLLEPCEGVLLFSATLGIGMDLLISKYGRVSPSRALMLQAIGTERIESLCDFFCARQAQEFRLTPRFSPGYGDLPLAFQKELFSVLDCPRAIGLTLNDSMSMSPSKSVTAVAGIIGSAKEE